MICWWDREVSIWALGKTAAEKENLEPLVGQRRKLVAKISLQVRKFSYKVMQC